MKAEIETTTDELRIYPNPGENTLNISYKGGLNNARLALFSVQGQKLQDKEIKSHHTSLDISNISPGIYYIVLDTGDRLINKKFIKK